MGKTPVPDALKRLVENFDRNLAGYHSPAYNETQLRRDFLDPFFEALGWDVANRKGYDQRYREVIHEDAIKVGGTTKAPDYCFRVGGQRKFFLEAKGAARTTIERQIAATDKAIDQLVYELYGLTEKETRIV